MEKKIPELEARNILENYIGSNNQLLDWKRRLITQKTFKLTRTQSEYVVKQQSTVPKIARKYVNIVDSFGEKLMEENLLTTPPKQIWVEKILSESDKAYHIWGKILEQQQMYSMWLPKMCVIVEEKKYNKIIDYSKYSIRPPMEHQKPAIERLLANNKMILADEQGVGKGLTIDTLIYTPNGTKKIGDLKIRDKVIGSDGLPYNVIGVYPQGLMDTYKITFNDGVSIVTDENHLWSVYRGSYRKDNKRGENFITLSTKQLLNKEEFLNFNGLGRYKDKTYYKYENGNLKWKIPTTKPIVFDDNIKLPIDPYLLGLMLGNGSMFMDNRLIDLELYNIDSQNKFIPDVYKYSSIENRVLILQGLMDTKKLKYESIDFSTSSERLCSDIIDIVHSLGGIARKKMRIPIYTYKGEKKEGRKSYKINIKLPHGINPFKLKRKDNISRYIKNIEYNGIKETVCISVDSPDKLYVAEHGVVTHNTTSAIIAAIESGVKKVLIVCPSSLKLNWKREIETYTKKRVLIAEGGKWGSTFDFYIINFDIIKNYHSIENGLREKSVILGEKFDLVIVDEAHVISNPTAIRTKLLNDLLIDIPKVWLLTGTPITSRPINYFNLLRIVDSPLTLNWQAYVKRYCGGYQFKANGKRIWNTSGATNLDELRERTKSVVLRRLKSDILDLPEKIITPIHIELNNLLYNQEFEEFIKITKEERKKDSISVTLNRLMKLRQIIALEKIPYTCELIDSFLEEDKKVIVFTNFTSTLDIMFEKYSKISVKLDGRMNKTSRQESIDKFQNNPKTKIFFGNIIAAGVGITLTAAEGSIMNDLSFVPSHHAQAEDRCHRIGLKHSVTVYYPLFENTIEMNVFNILQRKKNIIDQVMGDGEYSESFSKELFNEIF